MYFEDKKIMLLKYTCLRKLDIFKITLLSLLRLLYIAEGNLAIHFTNFLSLLGLAYSICKFRLCIHIQTHLEGASP